MCCRYVFYNKFLCTILPDLSVLKITLKTILGVWWGAITLLHLKRQGLRIVNVLLPWFALALTKHTYHFSMKQTGPNSLVCWTHTQQFQSVCHICGLWSVCQHDPSRYNEMNSNWSILQTGLFINVLSRQDLASLRQWLGLSDLCLLSDYCSCCTSLNWCI